MTVSSIEPGLAVALADGLRAAGEHALASKVGTLRHHLACDCYSADCRSFSTAAHLRLGDASRRRVTLPPYERHRLTVDVVDDKIVFVELVRQSAVEDNLRRSHGQ
jgi:hypothetical protein